MGDTITSQFIKAFDAKNEEHVKWLQTMTLKADTLSQPQDLVKNIQSNPMKIRVNEIQALDWPHIHFVLAMTYAKAVLTGKAYVPS
jgi:hypothetical protein